LVVLDRGWWLATGFGVVGFGHGVVEGGELVYDRPFLVGVFVPVLELGFLAEDDADGIVVIGGQVIEGITEENLGGGGFAGFAGAIEVGDGIFE